jgi:hypothetical protein
MDQEFVEDQVLDKAEDVCSYANFITPAFRSIKIPSIKNKLYKENKLIYKDITKIMMDTSTALGIDKKSALDTMKGELVFNSIDYPLWNFIERLNKSNDGLSNY